MLQPTQSTNICEQLVHEKNTGHVNIVTKGTRVDSLQRPSGCQKQIAETETPCSKIVRTPKMRICWRERKPQPYLQAQQQQQLKSTQPVHVDT